MCGEVVECDEWMLVGWFVDGVVDDCGCDCEYCDDW